MTGSENEGYDYVIEMDTSMFLENTMIQEFIITSHTGFASLKTNLV